MTVQRDVQPIYVVHYQKYVTSILETEKNTSRLSVAELLECACNTCASIRDERHI